MVKKQRYAVLYGEFENEKKKDKKFFDLPEQGFEPQIFSNFTAHDLNFHGRWGWRDEEVRILTLHESTNFLES